MDRLEVEGYSTQKPFRTNPDIQSGGKRMLRGYCCWPQGKPITAGTIHLEIVGFMQLAACQGSR